MKTKILPTLLLLSIGFEYSEARPQNYYWVVESTAFAQGSSIIRIYNLKDELVYIEKIEGRTLDITNKRVARQLNRKARKARALKENIAL